MIDTTKEEAETRGVFGVWVSDYAPWAMGLWVAQFIGALYACAVANLIFGISLGSAVDVLLALQVSTPLFIAGLYFIESVLARDFSDFLEFLTSIIAYILNPFAAILGYSLYAYFDRVHLVETSFVYAGFVGRVHNALIFVAHVGMRISIPHIEFIGSPQFFSWSNFIFGLSGVVFAILQRGLRHRSETHQLRARALKQ